MTLKLATNHSSSLVEDYAKKKVLEPGSPEAAKGLDAFQRIIHPPLATAPAGMCWLIAFPQ